MKKVCLKVITILFLLLFASSFCFASGGSTEEEAIKSIGQTIIGYLAWAGIVIAFGMLFFIRN